jgi:hypothetical protein
MTRRMIHHHHVVRGLYKLQGRVVKTSLEHEHVCDDAVPHFHSGTDRDGAPDPSTGGARTGPSMHEAPEPPDVKEGPARLRLWRPSN